MSALQPCISHTSLSKALKQISWHCFPTHPEKELCRLSPKLRIQLRERRSQAPVRHEHHRIALQTVVEKLCKGQLMFKLPECAWNQIQHTSAINMQASLRSRCLPINHLARTLIPTAIVGMNRFSDEMTMTRIWRSFWIGIGNDA